MYYQFLSFPYMLEAFQVQRIRRGPLKQDCHSTSHAHFSIESKKEHLLSTASSWGPAEAELEREEMPLVRTKAVLDTME